MCYNLKNALCIIICISILCITLKNANGQDIKVRTVKTDVPKEKTEKKETKDLSRYDGVSPFFDLQELIKNSHYYDEEKILFLPHSSHKYNFYGGFSLSTPEVIPDTIWSKDKKKIKRIEMVQCDVYKPVNVNEGKVHYFGKAEKLDASVILVESGFKTPVSAIEGKVFTIKNCTSSVVIIDKARWLVLKIIMNDKDGVEIVWKTEIYIDNSADYRFIPILMYSYIEKYQQNVGKKLVDYKMFNVNEPSSIETVLDDTYECTELSYIEENRIYEPGFSEIYYYSPVLFYTHKGKEVHQNIIPQKSFGWLPGKTSINSILMDPTEFKQRAYNEVEENKKAKEQQLLEIKKKEEEIKKAKEQQEEKKKKEEAARLSELTKKYGTQNAKLIMQEKVQIGWKEELCIESWGKPLKINRTTSASGVHEQWVYIGGYLYFDNGILTSIQN